MLIICLSEQKAKMRMELQARTPEAQGQALLTPRQYAEMKGWCLQTVYNHLWQGKLPEAKKFLDRWVICCPRPTQLSGWMHEAADHHSRPARRA
jgi:hypothetical protein